MDNEMVRTKAGLELSRITIINLEGELIYDSLVKPENEILDYNTKFSGMTYELLKDVEINLK
jgi:RNA exonuclease 1